MGEVYLAHDTKLNRDVALKVLPPELAENEERRARFKREAQAVAALNHPNIVTVHSVEEAEGVHFITMEYVRGKTLTELIPRKGLLLAKFFEIAIYLADAVSAAHEKGILHRDLKPDNVMMTDDGRLKILDFGLAKLNAAAGIAGISELPTRSQTEEGRIVGTVAYMSPEQAEGKTLDSRSDIFSLGIVLYEMATGERPFKGETTASVLSSILKDTPKSVTEVNPSLPGMLGRIIRRCLVKDPEHRYQTAKDLRNELQELKGELESGELEEGAPSRSKAGGRRTWLIVGIPILVVLAAVIYRLRPSREAATTALTTQFTQLTSLEGVESFPSLSADGNSFVYVSGASGNLDIYLQRVGGQKAINLTEDSNEDDTQPAFSPDGAQIVFRSERNGGGIFVMGATGESVKRVSSVGYNPAWSPDGKQIVFSTGAKESPEGASGQGGSLRIVRVDTGDVHSIDVGTNAFQPSWSPHGDRIAFWSTSLTGRNYRDVLTVPAEGGAVVPVTQDEHVDWNPVWSPDGKYIYFCSNRGGTMSLWRVAIEEHSGIVRGTPALVAASQAARVGQITVGAGGRHIAYQGNLGTENLYKVPFDPVSEHVIEEPVPITSGTRWANYPAISPDGKWVAFDFYLGGGQSDIAVMGADGTGMRQLTDEPQYANFMPRWSPDGSELVFYSVRSGSFELWTIQPDGGGLRQLTKPPFKITQFAWSPDGNQIAFYSDGDSYIFRPNVSWEEQTPERLPRPSEGSFLPNYWSRNGERLAGWVRNPIDGRKHVAVFFLNTQEYSVFPVEGMGDAWLSDNRRLLVGDDRKILLLDVETGRSHDILSREPETIDPDVIDISSDDRTIYFTSRRAGADIWMLTLDEKR